MQKESLALMQIQGRAGMKETQSISAAAVIEGCHYNTAAIPLLQLNELRMFHAFKLTGQKVADASESLWFCI